MLTKYGIFIQWDIMQQNKKWSTTICYNLHEPWKPEKWNIQAKKTIYIIISFIYNSE